MNFSACRPSLPVVLSGCKYTTDFETGKKKNLFFSSLLELVSSWKRMQTYNLFQIQNKQNFKLFSENLPTVSGGLFQLQPSPLLGSQLLILWSFVAAESGPACRQAGANLQPFLGSFQNKIQKIFRELFASITHSYWAHNAAVKAFIVSQSGCKYTPVFKSRKSRQQLF